MACSMGGIASSSEPVSILHLPTLTRPGTELRSEAITVSYSKRASSIRPCTRSSWPLTKCATALRGDAAKAWSTSPFARARSAATGSVIPIEHAVYDRQRQARLCLDCPRVERQRAFEQADRLGIVLARWTF